MNTIKGSIEPNRFEMDFYYNGDEECAIRMYHRRYYYLPLNEVKALFIKAGASGLHHCQSYLKRS